MSYYRAHFTDFLSDFGGLALTVISFINYLLRPFQYYVQSKALTRSLYGQRVDKSELKTEE